MNPDLFFQVKGMLQKKNLIHTSVFLFILCFTMLQSGTLFSVQAEEKLSLFSNAEITLLDYEISPERLLTLDEWDKADRDFINLGYTDQHVWIRLRTENEVNSGEKVIQLFSNQLDHAEFFLFDDGEIIQTAKAGDRIPFHEWTHKTLFPSIQFLYLKGHNLTVLIHVRSTGNLTFKVNQSDAGDFYRKKHLRELFLWINGGIEFLNIAFLLFLYRKERNPALLILIPVIFLWYLISCYLSSPVFAVWPENTHFQDQFLVIAGTTVSLLNLVFVKYFLRIRDIWPFWNRVMIFSGAAALYGYYSFLNPTELNYKLYLLNTVQVYIVLFVGIVRAHVYGLKSLKFLFLIFLFQGGLSVIKNLALLELIPFPPWVINTGAPADLITLVIPLSFIIVIRYYYDSYINIKQNYSKLESEYSRIPDLLRQGSEGGSFALKRLGGIDVADITDRIQNMVRTNECFFDEKFTLQQMAEFLSIRPDQLSAVLNSHLNLTFRTFLNSIRIHRACNLLREFPDKKIIEVTYESGFGSKAAFYEAFREIMKMTPKEYLKTIKENPDYTD